MANYIASDTDLTAVADAIRTKGGTSADLTFPSGFVTAIQNISAGMDFDDYVKNPPTFPSGDYVFNGTSMRDYAFAYLASVTTTGYSEWTIHAPNCTYLGQNAFRECRMLKEAHFPALTSFHSTNYIFFMPTSGTRKLALIDWGSCNITENLFKNAANLKTLILRKTTIATLGSTAAFTGTPFKSGGSGGTIYIPKALYDHLGDGTSSDYKAASNWSTVNGYGTITWAQIEGSQYELS